MILLDPCQPYICLKFVVDFCSTYHFILLSIICLNFNRNRNPENFKVIMCYNIFLLIVKCNCRKMIKMTYILEFTSFQRIYCVVLFMLSLCFCDELFPCSLCTRRIIYPNWNFSMSQLIENKNFQRQHIFQRCHDITSNQET